MSKTTCDAIKLYGTDEPVLPAQQLTAGLLTCEFDQGALRYIRIMGKEAIRNIAFVVRDQNWGTYLPLLSHINIEQYDHSFVVTFDAECGDDDQKMHYKATIRGDSDGSLSFTGQYAAKTDFLANRVGFVVLHPIVGVSGNPVTVEHVNGDVEHSAFPENIDPVQPFKDIRALTHEVSPGVNITCRMSGDTFEMEDHRQWNDASYKTYVRPLAMPWPYVVPASETLQQSVTITTTWNSDQIPYDGVRHLRDRHAAQSAGRRCVVTIREPDCIRPMPQIGLGLEPQYCTDALAHQDLLRKLAPQQLVVWHDLYKHTSADLERASSLARILHAKVELQVVIPDIDFKTEVLKLKAQCVEAGVNPHAIHAAPAAYLKSIMPGPSWPDVTSLATLYREIRHHFPDVLVGGGMLSFFPELNRHRPPVDEIDFISHSSNVITHACDDTSVMENLEALPYIVNTTRTFAGNKAYHVGPSSIGMRFNPYGTTTVDNPHNGRVAMARMDPRQRGLFNAAWTIGYVAHMARGGVDCVNLHAATGEFGILGHPERWPCPGYDGAARLVYPVFHALAGCIAGAGKPQLHLISSKSQDIQAVGYIDGSKRIIWIANLTREAYCIELEGFGEECTNVSTLSIDTFEQCTNEVDGFDHTATETGIRPLRVGPYSVVRLIA